MPATRTCHHCGVSIESKAPQARYCTKSCRNSHGASRRAREYRALRAAVAARGLDPDALIASAPADPA